MADTPLSPVQGVSRYASILHVVIPIFVLSISLSAGLGFFAGVLGGSYAPVLLQTLGIQLPGLERTTASSSDMVTTEAAPVLTGEDATTVGMVQRVSPSVVSIVIKKDLASIYRQTGTNPFPFDDFFEFGFPFGINGVPLPSQPAPKTDEKATPAPEKQEVGGGSGFIVTADGLILTNRHVVEDTEAEYTIVTTDGKEYPAKVLAKDPVNDLAIMKIEATGLTPLELGDSDQIEIGQAVVAIGNSLGEYKNTVTKGVVSGINRVIQAGNGYGQTEILQELIQTDAAINPGNSGGPLLDLTGRVIGINTAVNREGQAIGFALPINIAKRSVESVKKNGKIVRPWMGVRYNLVDKEFAQKNNLSVDYGAIIQGNSERKELGVVAGSPAEKAGLGEGDIILEVNGQKISYEHALANEIVKYAPGETVKLKILSRGATKEVSLTLEEYQEPKPVTEAEKKK